MGASSLLLYHFLLLLTPTCGQNLKASVEEVFFVVSYRDNDPIRDEINELCSYKNVLCIEYEELQFESKEEVKMVVNNLTNKFRARFEVR